MTPDREEQISKDKLRRRLAEWAGFKWNAAKNHWIDPSGNHDSPPNFVDSLDARFHWLMPLIRLIRIDYIGSGIWLSGEITEWQVGIV